ncbi:MAG: hypothetical protein HY658_15020 [Actinobacteria bacterium]|nr:hypothetical protein [Actinomycetota bacterium]
MLLVQHHDIADPDHGGSYTVKVYRREPSSAAPDGERRDEVRLEPDSDDPRYRPIVLTYEEGVDQVRVIAELVQVLARG